jgi:hypothetical protein
MNCCICGPVKNCYPYLDKVFENIEKIATIFNDYKIVVFYDKSTDNTLQKLQDYQKQNSKLLIYINQNPTFRFRTHNLAVARNFCLNYVKENKEQFPFFIMMDFDDVNSKTVNTHILKKKLHKNNWDALSFNTTPNYYDIWALSIYPFCFSYNHYKNHTKYHTIIQTYIENLLKKIKPDGLLNCISAFNGFAIYKTAAFLDTYYDGRVRSDLLPQYLLDAHSKACDSEMQFIQCETVDGRFEDCEHRCFHIMASQNSGAKIRISPEILFT